MTCPNQPEYLQLFSNEGPVAVQVKFSGKSDSHRSIAKMNMHWVEFDRLIDSETGNPYKTMNFDSYSCPVVRFEIDPVKNVLTIIVGTTGLP